ncbi:transcription initiation protein [Chitinophaga silvatica]|uniref:Transcription initiation protein n=1 Tax=Chitinophaga silvatica TaxID=2282649 RepID=A0A3E1YB53_9BACT|nr:YciI family protein [Chitinophaga silvatica]RFS22711.1 transcription initiation protein [Chitinophaga silvatica]
MEEFALLFRQQEQIDNTALSPKEMEKLAQKWESWVSNLKEQDRFICNTRLAPFGKVLKPGGIVTDGPFVEIKERLGGLFLVRAENLEEATTLAHGCPILDIGGSVEVRPLFQY